MPAEPSRIEALKQGAELRARKRADQDEKIRRLYAEGMSIADIGRRLGLSSEGVRGRLKLRKGSIRG